MSNKEIYLITARKKLAKRALHLAIEHLVEYLVNMGIDVNLKDINFKTDKNLAYFNDHKIIVVFLDSNFASNKRFTL